MTQSLNPWPPEAEMLAELLAKRLGWRRLFSKPTLERGLEYQRQHRVHGLEIRLEAPDHYVVLAQVQGTEPEAYRTRVKLRRSGPQWIINGSCTCPVQQQCKHVAATLAQLESPAVDPLQGWERWIRSVEQDASQPVRQEVEPQRRLMLILSRSAPRQLQADPVWVKPGRGGGWTSPTRISHSSHGPVPMPAGGWSDSQETALSVLLSGQGYYSYRASPIAITSRAQEQALDSLGTQGGTGVGTGVSTGVLVCWEKPGQLLTRGPTAELSLGWTTQPGGNEQLVPIADGAPDGAELLRGASLWYVSPLSAQYGRVDGNPEVLDRLRMAPVVPPGQAQAVRERLRRVPRLRSLMTPAAERPRTRTLRARARPLLELRAIPRIHGGEPVGVAQLLFDYDGHRIPPGRDPVQELDLTDEHLAIQRNRADENAAFEALGEHQLVAAEVYTDLLRQDQLRPGDHVYIPRQQPAGVHAWLSLLPRLRDDGFELLFAPDFPLQLLDAPTEIQLAVQDQSEGGWFDLSLGFDLNGERIDLLPVLRRALADPGFPMQPSPREAEDAQWLLALDERRVIALPLARLRAIVQPLLEWLQDGSDGQPRLRSTHSDVLDALSAAPGVVARGGEELRERARRLRAGPVAVDPEPGFQAQLRPYQREGLAWLDLLEELGVGGVLADDMGLGKTVQVLAHLHGLKARGRLQEPALVVCPTSLVGNWAAEAARFSPKLRVLVLHGPQRASAFADIASSDLVITTYPLLPRDEERLCTQRFKLLVLDESQQVKNARTQAAGVVRQLQAQRRLAMTGTPLENHLGELWAQFDAVEPGLLGSERQFTRHYRTPIEKQDDPQRRAQLLARIAPLMLRRRKQDVLTDLPDKTEIQRPVELEGRQRELYETLRLAQHERVREAVATRGLAGSGIVVLDALLKLRQVCCDPRLVKLPGARRVAQSAKLELLLELVDELVAEGRRILVFSQFTEMLELIAQALDQRGLSYLQLTGQTRGRAALVERFQNGEVPLFLISLKAGGTGLNLTAADTVIHYDPWWNPAVEAQATDRAHRIGQKNAVFVYRLICTGTVEEKIQALQGNKAELARAVLEGGSSARLRFDETDLDALFGPSTRPSGPPPSRPVHRSPPMAQAEIWHNPRCSKSRDTLKLLTERGIQPQVRLYLDSPPSVEDLARAVVELDQPASALVRFGEPRAKELGLKASDARSDAEWILLLAANPVLIERPLVLANGRAALGRPPEEVLKIL